MWFQSGFVSTEPIQILGKKKPTGRFGLSLLSPGDLNGDGYKGYNF